MKTSTALGVAFGILVAAAVGVFLQTWVLGIILSWFGVTLTFWQNLLIILLANSFRTNVSSK
jgi:hypothetical protein